MRSRPVSAVRKRLCNNDSETVEPPVLPYSNTPDHSTRSRPGTQPDDPLGTGYGLSRVGLADNITGGAWHHPRTGHASLRVAT